MAVFSLSTLVQNTPPATRALTATLLALSSLLFILRLRTGLGFSTASAVQFPWLVIVPGSSFWYPWTLIVSSFCESSIFEFLVSIVSLPLAGRYLERQWGGLELVKFCIVVLVGSNLIAWGLQLLLFVVFRDEALIFRIQFHGLQALQTGFLVAFTQLIPEHQVQILRGAVKLRVRDLPMLYVTVSNIACLFGQTSPWILIQFGWLLSWAYLRFIKLNESGYKGDRSEAFAFINWFPPFAHPVVQVISNTLFAVFCKVGIVQPWSGGDYTDLEASLNDGQSPAQGSARAEAERRRAMALKALDQRLTANKPTGSRTSTLQRSDSVRSASSASTQAAATDTTPLGTGTATEDEHALPTVVFEAPEEKPST